MARKKRFQMGDLVTHVHRGDGEFEHYGADDSTCFVKFSDSHESERVTSSLVKSRVLVPKPQKCALCRKSKGDHHAKTHGCLVGRPGRIGYTVYSTTTFFKAKE